MEKASAEDGSGYKSHYLQSPLSSEAILETCAACHKDTDMAEKVHAVQAEVTARETEVGEKLSALKDKLAEAVAGGEYSEEELDEIRKLHRTAQWFFDYDYVENSEGAHNSTLAKKCLDTAESVIDEAMGRLGS
jgi:nitrite reductase (cytochrome c-552)